MKNILLTGSGGFIGKHVKSFLQPSYSLYTPRSYELNLLNKDEVFRYVQENYIDFIIHSASYGVRITADAKMEDVAGPNVEMFNNLACLNIPMIVFGSGAEYDKSGPLIKVKENDFGKSLPKDPYGYSKYLISKEIEKLNHIINLRIFGIYGIGEDASRVTTYIVKQNINRQPIVLNQNVVFDFIYIDDFCKIVRHFVENNTSEKFINVCSGSSVEILDLANMVNRFSDFQSEIIIKNSGFNKEYTGSNEKLLAIMKGFDFTTYEQGMKKLFKGMERE